MFSTSWVSPGLITPLKNKRHCLHLFVLHHSKGVQKCSYNIRLLTLSRISYVTFFGHRFISLQDGLLYTNHGVLFHFPSHGVLFHFPSLCKKAQHYTYHNFSTVPGTDNLLHVHSVFSNQFQVHPLDWETLHLYGCWWWDDDDVLSRERNVCVMAAGSNRNLYGNENVWKKIGTCSV